MYFVRKDVALKGPAGICKRSIPENFAVFDIWDFLVVKWSYVVLQSHSERMAKVICL